jgi:hypothetical protein
VSGGWCTVAEEIVEVRIGPDGAVDVRVSGIEGMGCVTETGELITLLGGDVEEHELTGEAYAEVREDQREQLWQ